MTTMNIKNEYFDTLKQLEERPISNLKLFLLTIKFEKIREMAIASIEEEYVSEKDGE